MKKLFYLLTIFILALSCSVDEEDEKFINYNTNGVEDEAESKIEINPAFYVAPNMEGTDFGNFFKTLYKHGRFEDMLAFTSSKSVEKFGRDVVLEFYKNELKFGYELGDKPISQFTSDDIITLNYNANIIATKRVVRINVVIENDSCKIVLPNDLKNFPS